MRRFALFLLVPSALAAQTPLTFEEYNPPSTLVVPAHPVTRARFPFVDVHSHTFNAYTMTAQQAAALVRDMDAMNMKALVNLSGGWGDSLAIGLRNMKGRYPTRFMVFANIDFRNIDQPDFGARAAAQLERDVRNGAQGLKIDLQNARVGAARQERQARTD